MDYQRITDKVRDFLRADATPSLCAVIALALINKLGTLGAYVDPTTGKLVNAAGTPFVASTDPLAINTQVADYTLALTDRNKYVRMNKGTAVNVTVPPNASVAFALGDQVILRNTGAGQVTVVAGGGVTVNTAQTLKLRAQHSSAVLVKVGTDEWDLAGDLESA